MHHQKSLRGQWQQDEYGMWADEGKKYFKGIIHLTAHWLSPQPSYRGLLIAEEDPIWSYQRQSTEVIISHRASSPCCPIYETELVLFLDKSSSPDIPVDAQEHIPLSLTSIWGWSNPDGKFFIAFVKYSICEANKRNSKIMNCMNLSYSLRGYAEVW